MQLSIDLTGRDVLVTGTDTAARQAVRRYEAAGAVVHRLPSPYDAGLAAQVPEGTFLIAAVEDGQPGWAPFLARCREAGIPIAAEPAAGPAGHITLVGGGPGTTRSARRTSRS